VTTPGSFLCGGAASAGRRNAYLTVMWSDNAVTLEFAATPRSPILATDPPGYQPGVCNIGPDEIAKRRRTGHLGVIATVVTFLVLVALGVPPIARFLVAIPAALAASGYLQAYFKFCVAFGSAGVFNFGARGTTEHVADPEARSRDRQRVLQLSLGIAAVAISVGVLAVLIPLP
jgi:hypothetical protein